MKHVFWLLLLAVSFTASAQTPFRIDSLPAQGLRLDKGWKWHAGDNPNWAKIDVDDSRWEPINPNKDIMDVPQLWKSDVNWLRFTFTADSLLVGKSIAGLIRQTAATEVYLNGQLISRFGEINIKTATVEGVVATEGMLVALPITKPGLQVLSVRFAIQKGIPYVKFSNGSNRAFSIRLIETKEARSLSEPFLLNSIKFSEFGIFFIDRPYSSVYVSFQPF